MSQPIDGEGAATPLATPSTETSRPHTILASAWRLARDPIVLILVVAGIADMVSGAPFTHGLVLIVAAAAILGDAARRRSPAARAFGRVARSGHDRHGAPGRAGRPSTGRRSTSTRRGRSWRSPSCGPRCRVRSPATRGR